MADSVIAIDGPAASGKSTVAARLARRLGIAYVNTGNMFRAVTLAARRVGITKATDCTAEKLIPVLERLELDYERNAEGDFELRLNGTFPGEALRSPEVAALVSPVATVGPVREFLKKRQREMAGHGWLVMEGRDIGTVIFPHARYKFFVTASPLERARRRLAQEGENFSGATLEEVAKAIAERDRIDSTREIAPLKPAPGAIVVDTTGLTIEQVVERLAGELARA